MMHSTFFRLLLLVAVSAVIPPRIAMRVPQTGLKFVEFAVPILISTSHDYQAQVWHARALGNARDVSLAMVLTA